MDTGAGGGNYMSEVLWHNLTSAEIIPARLNESHAGALRVANPSKCKIPSMRITGSTVVPVRLTNDDRVRRVEVRIVKV